ncbi:hypothetical protein INT47_001250 [Mucor saturninus]|uniref:Rho-GAP domain-containing protein n=1 Tax=Mucor saturninus TaxID=64648 RepID=A0A8H7VB64_9FUNG|nr:hypothetical protein INT47_001250 [Mucor saturninus]
MHIAMPHHHSFQQSFWSPTASVDAVPNFNTGFSVLHGKLRQSAKENRAIIEYIRHRISAEKLHAKQLSTLVPGNNPFDADMGGALKRCFEVVYSESIESTKEHEIRATNLHTTALDPLLQFSLRYDRIIATAKQTVDAQLGHFETLCRHMELAKSNYTAKCKALLLLQPDYQYEYIRLDESLEFLTRDHVWIWLQDLLLLLPMKRDAILAWLQEKHSQNEGDAIVLLDQLEKLEFLTQNMDLHPNGDYSKFESTPSSPSKKGFATGFLGRWNTTTPSAQLIKKSEMEMMAADTAYRAAVGKVEKMRTQVEQVLFVHYEEMQSLELERIATIKQVFISVAASLSNTIPRCKETFDNMMLYQETLEPDKDVQFIVEQYRTECPEFYFLTRVYPLYQKLKADQLFGVHLEEITRAQPSLVPPLVSQGLSVIESGFSRLYDEEKSLVWTTSVPLDRVHAAREEINHCTVDKTALEKYDVLLLASLIRLYLMELPECLFTFELYEPFKLIYANQGQQDKDTRLCSISKLLATLPTCNYKTVMLLLGHFYRLVKELDNHALATSLAKSFSYILLRPKIETKVSAHERHAQRLLQDLIENYEVIFTAEASKAQEENSSRPSIIINATDTAEKSSSLDETVVSTRTSSSSSTRRSSILSFMRTSQSTPTSSISIKRTNIPIIPSSSTLFEDPDELISSESSILIHTPPSYTSTSHPHQHKKEHYIMDDLASLDSFFEDEDD